MFQLYLKKGREDNLSRRHPWVFSGAVGRLDGKPLSGQTVRICAVDGKPLAVGAWSPESQIRVRVWDFAPDTVIDDVFLRQRLQQALDARKPLMARSNALRLVYSEADGLPGLIVDRYADTLVCQFLSAGVEYHKATLVRLLAELSDCTSIYERSDASVREKEGLSQISGLLVGAEPPELIEINEDGCRYLVDVRRGHKTGFYLDQRDNREAVQAISRDATVLNCFSYTGGFGLAALAGGAAHVTNLDSSAPSLQLAARNIANNGYKQECYQNIEADAFECLRQMQRDGRRFDIIVLDPPKFVDGKAQLQRGARAYKDINMQAFKLLPVGGLLFTFSCSGQMPVSLFQKIVADAALDAGCSGQIIRQLAQAADHPISLNFPEAAYLKGFCVRKAG